MRGSTLTTASFLYFYYRPYWTHETYVAYSLNRIFDTAVGVIVALLVNYFLPRERVVACWEKVKGLFRPLEHS